MRRNPRPSRLFCFFPSCVFRPSCLSRPFRLSCPFCPPATSSSEQRTEASDIRGKPLRRRFGDEALHVTLRFLATAQRVQRHRTVVEHGVLTRIELEGFGERAHRAL